MAGQDDAFAQPDARLRTDLSQTTDVEQFGRCAIQLGSNTMLPEKAMTDITLSASQWVSAMMILHHGVFVIH